MTTQTDSELFCSVSKELDSDGKINIKYAFFSNNFALAVRIPWESATEMISGLRENTLKLTKEIMQEEKRVGKQLDVVKGIPDALQRPQNPGRV